MKVLLDMAMSPSGMIARENGQEDWLPEVGWNEFLAEAKKYGNIVMGRETYELVNKFYEHETFDQAEAVHKVVVSRDPDLNLPSGYTVVVSPQAAVEYIKAQGLTTLFLIGSGRLNGSFLEQGLVDEIHLAVTPYLIGKGRSLVGSADFDTPLKLLDVHEISGGRVSLSYEVIE